MAADPAADAPEGPPLVEAAGNSVYVTEEIWRIRILFQPMKRP